MPQVFISYARIDEPFARRLAAALSESGADVWLDVDDIPAGMNWSSAIQQGLDDSELMIVILSPESMASRNVENEWQFYLDEGKPVVPVLYRKTRVHFQLNRLQYINFESQPFDKAWKQLHAELGRNGLQLKPLAGVGDASGQIPLQPALPVLEASPLPSSSTGSRNWRIGGALLAVITLLGVGLTLLNNLGPSSNATPTTTVVAGPSQTPGSEFSLLDPLQVVGLTQTHEAGQTLTAIPTATFTPTTDFNATVDAIATGTRAALQTATAASWTDTPTPTATFTPTNTPLPPGFTPITRNADWTPITQDFNSVTMVLVPAGCFDMGSEDGGDDEKPVHEQCFDVPFWIDQTEVTQADFERLNGQKANPNAFDGDQRPVENITWFEARDFCALRGMRLPTEHEWEYAARGPDNLIYPWGNDWDPNNAVWSGNSNSQTATVGSRPDGVSWVGVLDMSGNIWEWLSTIYGIDGNGDYNFTEAGERRYSYPYNMTDGREEKSELRTIVLVRRGGSWNSVNTTFLRSPDRFRAGPDDMLNNLGFRCALSS